VDLKSAFDSAAGESLWLHILTWHLDRETRQLANGSNKFRGDVPEISTDIFSFPFSTFPSCGGMMPRRLSCGFAQKCAICCIPLKLYHGAL